MYMFSIYLYVSVFVCACSGILLITTCSCYLFGLQSRPVKVKCVDGAVNVAASESERHMVARLKSNTNYGSKQTHIHMRTQTNGKV